MLCRRTFVSLVAMSAAFGCALPHQGQTDRDGSVVPDVANVEGGDVQEDRVVAPDVPPDVANPLDVASPPDVMVRDAPSPRDVQPDRPSPVDVPVETLPAGSSCVSGSTPTCASGTECFTYASGSFCSVCGGYGQRPCDTNTCYEGSYDAFAGICVHPPGTAMGMPGGACVRSSDCASGQCWLTSNGTGACLSCGATGEPCCCSRGSGCSCSGTLTCALPSMFPGWTVCY